MKYTKAIERAIANAAPLEFQDGRWVSRSPDDIVIAHDVPRRGGHNYPLAWPERDDLSIPPFYVCTTTPDELRDVIFEHHRISNLPTEGDTLKTIDEEVRHEGQHAEAAIALGAASSLYVLRVCRSTEGTDMAWQVSHIPTGLKTTKLGAAVMCAYPDQPSPSDMGRVYNFGYGSVAEVGELAQEYGLPLPLQVQKR